MKNLVFVNLLFVALFLGVIAANEEKVATEKMNGVQNINGTSPNINITQIDENLKNLNKQNDTTTGKPQLTTQNITTNGTTKPTLHIDTTQIIDTTQSNPAITTNATDNTTITAATTTTTTTKTTIIQPHSIGSNSSVKPPIETKSNVVLESRGFHGPSFIGGIVLSLGLIVIGYMGLKYYKAQTERNYHTL